MSGSSNELATNANTVTIMIGSYLNMSQMISSGVVPGLVATGGIGLDALDYDMADATYNGSYQNNLVTQLAGAWAGAGSGTQEMSEYSGISAGTLALTNTTGSTIDVAAQGAIFTAADGSTYETEEAPTNAAWSNGNSQTGYGYYVIAPGQTINVAIEATFQGDDAKSDAAGSIDGSSIAGIAVSQASALSPGSSYTNPENNSQGTWLTNDFGNYTFVFTDQGLAPAEGHVNINGGIAWTPTDVASWDGYVDNARNVGILNVAPLESGTVPAMDQSQPFATSAFFTGYRAAALYGGGYEIELPSYYWFALSASEQQTVIEQIRWCNANGLRSSLLVNNQVDFQGDPDPNFAADTVLMLHQLQAEGALPSQIVLENDNSTSIGSYYDTNPADVNSLNAVATALLRDFSFTPSASEDGLEVKGTSTAQTTLIMTGVRPSEDAAAGALSPYATAQVFGEHQADALTLSVTDTNGLLALADTLDGATAQAGGTVEFSGTAAQATVFLHDLQATASSGTAGVAHLELTLTDDNGATTEGVTSVYLGNVHPVFTAVTEGAAAAGALSAGDLVLFTVATSAAVTVSGAPELLLTNERYATYTGQDGAGRLVFSYRLQDGDAASLLRVRGLRLFGATIADSNTGLLIDPDSIDAPEEAMASLPAAPLAADTITGVSETAAAAGALTAGEQITVVLGADRPISAVEGSPTLSLNNGAVAAYAGLTPSGLLQFTTLVPAEAVSTGLAPIALNMNGAVVTDDAGVVVSAPAVLPRPAFEVTYNTVTDTIVSVAESTASPGALVAGEQITIVLSAAEPVVAVNGKPTLSLNNGEVATYAGLTSAGQMKFSTTVPAGSVATALLATALNLNGAAVTNSLGEAVVAPPSLPRPAVALAYNTTTDPIDTITEVGPAGTLEAGSVVTFLLGAGQPVATVSGSPTLSLNNGEVATYAGLTAAGQIEFATSVPSNSSFSGLAPTALDMGGAVVTDMSGAAVVAPRTLPAPPALLSYDTVEPTLTLNPPTTTPPASPPIAIPHPIGAPTVPAAPVDVVTAVDGVPISTLAGTAFGAASPLAGGAASLSLGSGHAIVDPTGNTETLAHLYQAVLGRAPDFAGLQTWINLVNSGGMSIATAAASFVGSAEFASRFGALTDAQFVGVLARNVSGSASTASEGDFIDALAAGTSRGTVALQFAESATNVLGTLSMSGDSGYGEVYRIYETTLGRAPDPAGLPGYLSALQSGASLQSIVQDFTASQEYFQDFGNDSNTQFVTELYKLGLGRAPDPAGLQNWVNDLSGGMSRSNVVLAISDSTESRADTASATHDNWVFLQS